MVYRIEPTKAFPSLPLGVNDDVANEALVRESSSSCCGNSAEAFVLVDRNAKTELSTLLDEVGGPGMGPFPMFCHNGTKYARKQHDVLRFGGCV